MPPETTRVNGSTLVMLLTFRPPPPRSFTLGPSSVTSVFTFPSPPSAPGSSLSFLGGLKSLGLKAELGGGRVFSGRGRDMDTMAEDPEEWWTRSEGRAGEDECETSAVWEWSVVVLEFGSIGDALPERLKRKTNLEKGIVPHWLFCILSKILHNPSTLSLYYNNRQAKASTHLQVLQCDWWQWQWWTDCNVHCRWTGWSSQSKLHHLLHGHQL